MLSSPVSRISSFIETQRRLSNVWVSYCTCQSLPVKLSNMINVHMFLVANILNARNAQNLLAEKGLPRMARIDTDVMVRCSPTECTEFTEFGSVEGVSKLPI